MRQRERGNEFRTTIVCVDSYEHAVPTGRFYTPYLSEGVRFESLMDLLQKIENVLDGMDFPQAFTITRSFAPARVLEAAPVADRSPCGALATFSLKVLFRQNSSWQGSLTWLEGRMEEGFRSVLELLFLMNSALMGEK